MSDRSDEELLADLGLEAQKKVEAKYTPKQERIIAGFEDIQRFYDEHGRAPLHGEDRDIFERLYAIRLDRMIEDEEMSSLVMDFDHQGLLRSRGEAIAIPDSDDELLAALGVDTEPSGLTELTHVRSATERRAAAGVATRDKCEDFDQFKPLFEQVQKDLDSAVRTTIRFKGNTRIDAGDWFIVDGQKALVVGASDKFFLDTKGNKNYRMRVVFDNGTESYLLKRSLERALQKDDLGRRISEPSQAPLFSDQAGEEDIKTGTVYVLRSDSDNPYIKDNRALIHKIGVTTQPVKSRVANAAKDATFLYAPVEVVATFDLYNISAPHKFEGLLHKVFSAARLDIAAAGQLGEVSPKEWFLVPLEAIEDAVEKLIAGELTRYVYDVRQGQMTPKK